MTDTDDSPSIVQRLRDHADRCESRQVYDSEPSLYREAAEVLERLQPPTHDPNQEHADMTTTPTPTAAP